MPNGGVSKVEGPDCIGYIPWRIFGSVTLILPVFGLFFAVVYSILYDFETTNSTHCRVWNFLPSISAATASLNPQKTVWFWSIMLHTPPRYVICFSYCSFYINEMFAGRDNSYGAVVMLLNAIEITALWILTAISSESVFSIHRNAFLTFLVTSAVYMTLTIRLHRDICQTNASLTLRRSLMYKKLFAALYVLFMIFAGYLYWRHNSKCEPGVYSMFALSEYMVVLTNISFHGTAIMDFIAYNEVGKKYGLLDV